MSFNYRVSPKFIKQRTGGYWYQTYYVSGNELRSVWNKAVPTQAETDTSTRVWTQTVSKSDTIKRVRPVGMQVYSNAGMTSRVYEEITDAAGINSDNTGNYWPNQPPGVVSPEGSLAQRVDADALFDFLENIKGEKFNLPVFALEGKEAVSFVTDVIKGLAKTYSAVKRGRFGDLYRTVLPSSKGSYEAGSRIVDKSANMWLQWRYAVQPMVYDFQAALELHAAGDSRLTIRPVKGYSSQTYNRVIKGSDYYVTTSQGKYSVEYGGYYTVEESAELRKRLGLVNFAQALYETTPASFILDWVCPIGRTIGAADALVGVNLLGWYRKTKISSVATRQRLWKPAEGYQHPYQAYGSPSTTTQKLYSRVIAPPITVPIPQVSESLSLTRVADAIAIAHGLVRGFRS